MKRGTPRHPKVAHLAELLGRQATLPLVVGTLELLWHFTEEFAPQGDIGKYSDKRIEAALDSCFKPPGKLIRCLIEAGWLEQDDAHRLLVHDWQMHCCDIVKRKLQRAGLPFLSVTRKVTENRPPALAIALPEPKPEPEPPAAQRNGLGAEPWDWFRETWPAAVPETLEAMRTFAQCVNTPDKLAALEANLPRWNQTRKFQEGFAGSWVKFLRSEVWLLAPKPAEMNGHSPPRKSRKDQMFEEMMRDAEAYDNQRKAQ